MKSRRAGLHILNLLTIVSSSVLLMTRYILSNFLSRDLKFSDSWITNCIWVDSEQRWTVTMLSNSMGQSPSEPSEVGGNKAPPKRCYPTTSLHGVTTQWRWRRKVLRNVGILPHHDRAWQPSEDGGSKVLRNTGMLWFTIHFPVTPFTFITTFQPIAFACFH